MEQMAKKLFTILFGVALILPLYSQETGLETGENPYEYGAEETQVPDEPPKKNGFTRKYFEIGFDAGAGFDNGLLGISDFFKEELVIDLSELSQGISKNGAGLNFSLSPGFFINITPVGKGLWGFGVLFNIEGSINANISKSLFTLISEGNINERDSAGDLSVSGGIFTEIGMRSWAQYEVAGRTLYIGVKPSIFTPVVYIQSNSGISYNLSTEREGREGIFVHSKGEINIYTPTSLENIKPGRFILPSGFDLSLEGEYGLFPFLDVGGSFSNIPLAAALLTNLMKISMTEFDIPLTGEDLMTGNISIPDIELKRTYDNNVELKVRRLLRFDIYARYRPLNSELLVLKPNAGFSANINKGDEEFFFNAGLEARLNLKNIFAFYIGSGYKETIWMHKAGLCLNLRAFELDLEAALRDRAFSGAFKGRGFHFNLGLRFGW
jgi:hypothetical protein